MKNLTKILVGAVLSGNGQILLLILLLAGGLAVRYTWFSSESIPLDRLGFMSETSQEKGAVVFSRTARNQLLVLEKGQLYWTDGVITINIVENVVNLHSHQGRFWAKTNTEIGEINILNGSWNQLVTVDRLGEKGIAFAQARLIGVQGDRFYLSNDDGVRVIEERGIVGGPYHFEGRRNFMLVEPSWFHGVLFVQNNSWTMYINFQPRKPVQLGHNQGDLLEALLSPDVANVMYAVQKGPITEIWFARANGSGAELLYQNEMNFSSLKAIWSPDSTMVVVNVLGYEIDAGLDDRFHSTTFLYQPGNLGTAVLSTSQGSEVRALFPTTWDSTAQMIWFYWLHEEEPVPVTYNLFRQ